MIDVRSISTRKFSFYRCPLVPNLFTGQFFEWKAAFINLFFRRSVCQFIFYRRAEDLSRWAINIGSTACIPSLSMGLFLNPVQRQTGVMNEYQKKRTRDAPEPIKKEQLNNPRNRSSRNYWQVRIKRKFIGCVLSIDKYRNVFSSAQLYLAK